MQINIQNGNGHFYSSQFGCLTRLLVMMASVILAAWLLPGVEVRSAGAVLLTAIVISILNNLVRPILVVLARPANMVSLILVMFAINILTVLMASGIVKNFYVDGIGWAALFSVVLTAISYLLELPARLARKPFDPPSPPTSDTDSDGFTPYEEVDEDE